MKQAAPEVVPLMFVLVLLKLASIASGSFASPSSQTCAVGGAGTCYVTKALKRIPDLDAASCCGACASFPSSTSAPEGCGVWMVQTNGECVLKAPGARGRPCPGNMPNSSASGTLSPGPSPGPPPPSPSFKPLYSVQAGTLKVSGLLCQPTNPNVNIYYPSNVTKGILFPVVVFGHGSGGNVGGFANPLSDSLIGFVAGMGMIVVAAAPHDHADLSSLEANTSVGCSPDLESLDMLHVIDQVKALPRLHPALAHASFTSTGIFGHSMGGEASPLAAQEALKRGNYSLKAMLSSHSWFKGQDAINACAHLNGIATMFTTCEDDGHHAQADKAAFQSCPGRPKVFANLVNGSHMEPIQGRRNNEFDARFLACHVASHKPSCDAIYNKSMCAKEAYVECDVVMMVIRNNNNDDDDDDDNTCNNNN